MKYKKNTYVVTHHILIRKDTKMSLISYESHTNTMKCNALGLSKAPMHVKTK